MSEPCEMPVLVAVSPCVMVTLIDQQILCMVKEMSAGDCAVTKVSIDGDTVETESPSAMVTTLHGLRKSYAAACLTENSTTSRRNRRASIAVPNGPPTGGGGCCC